MSALDHADAAWYRPTFQGAAGKIGGLGRTAKAQWTAVTNAGALAPGHAAFQVTRQPAGTTQLHYVNAIDPADAGTWLLPGVELDTWRPARMPI